jgi:hypothetical protein
VVHKITADEAGCAGDDDCHLYTCWMNKSELIRSKVE